jgi:arylsulfatase A
MVRLPEGLPSMDRRGFLQTTGAALAAVALPGWRGPAEQAARGPDRPNIIFILSDDVGMSEIGCYGVDAYKTPNIDGLATAGTRFEYCYAMPLCGPSRACALTGRYPFRTGLIDNQSQQAIQPNRETMIPTLLKRAGYVSVHVGKWGQMSLGPAEWGFDEHLVWAGSGRYWAGQNTGGKNPERAARTFYIENGTRKPLAVGAYMPDLMHAFLVDFMRRHQQGPFFAYYCMSHVHAPILRTPDSKVGATPDQLYADNVAYMDKLVGRLVGELRRLKLDEKTLVVFTGDNGTARFGQTRSTLNGRQIHGQKGTMMEGGSRVPLVAAWPGTTPAGVVNRDLTDFSDFFPTFAEVAGAAVPASLKVDGRSFAPQLKGRTGAPREWVYVELAGRSYVRDARYKLTNGGELFDMKDAPFSEVPIPKRSGNAEASAARARLQRVLDDHPTAPGQGKKEARGVRRKKQLTVGRRQSAAPPAGS